jgi:hypothetical protein
MFGVVSCAAQSDSLSSPNIKEMIIGGGLSYPYLPSNFKDDWSRGVHVTGGYGYSKHPGSLEYVALYATSRNSIAPYFLDITVAPDSTAAIPGGTASSVLWVAGAGVDIPFHESIASFLQGAYHLHAAGDPPGWQHVPVSGGIRSRL